MAKRKFVTYSDIPGAVVGGAKKVAQGLSDSFTVLRGPGYPIILPKSFFQSTPAEERQKAIESPSAAVSDEFTPESEDELGLDLEMGLGGGGGGEGMTFPLVETPPPLVTPEQIPGLFGPLMSEIQGQEVPLGRPVPQGLGPTRTFLANFAASMATQMTRNPAILENIQGMIAERERQKKAIEDQNYAENLLFNKEKRNSLIALRGQILEKQLNLAIEQGDDEAARVAAENLERLRIQGNLEVEKERGRQEQQKERVKASLESKTGKTREIKPLTMDQFLSQVKDISTADPDKISEMAGQGRGFLGLSKTAASKQAMLESIYAGAAIGGETAAVKTLGLTRLVNSIKSRLNLPSADVYNKMPPERQAAVDQRVANELAKYGINLGK